VSWRLERDQRAVTFASCRQLSVYTDTTSTALSAVHARPAWTLLVPVEGGRVTVFAGTTVRVDDDGVLVPPLTWHRVTTHGSHVAVYLDASMAARAGNARPRLVPGPVARRMLESLAVDSGIDFDSGVAGLDPSFRNPERIDPRVAFAMDAVPDAYRLDVLAAEIGMSPSRLRALVRDAVGAPLTQLRLWSRLGRALALLPYASTAGAAATAGFADQAHLTRTARRFLGRTPAELSLRSLELRPPNPRWRASAAAGRT
jgi:AraC-like DNA-binding protein